MVRPKNNGSQLLWNLITNISIFTTPAWCSGLVCDSRPIHFIIWAGMRSINCVYGCDNPIKPGQCSQPLYTMICAESISEQCQDIIVILINADLWLYGIIQQVSFSSIILLWHLRCHTKATWEINHGHRYNPLNMRLAGNLIYLQHILLIHWSMKQASNIVVHLYNTSPNMTISEDNLV